jgi:CO/xanthine dehydrogenase FAD-binding subunit
MVLRITIRIARPGYLIDINRIAGLSYIKEEDGYLKIGGSHAKLTWKNSPLTARTCVSKS